MNRSTLSSSKKKSSISLSKACDGFLKFKVAEGLSQRTIDSYEIIYTNGLITLGIRMLPISTHQISPITWLG